MRKVSSIISSYNYSLGPSGNRVRVQENTGRVVDYTYDVLYRLTQESITDPLLGNRIITYSYDPVGNRLLKNDTVEGPTNYTYDENDRLLTENGTTYLYDNNGNTIGKTISNNKGSDITTYIYDYENRLVGAQTPNAAINYIYDADGIRVSSIVNGAVANYLIDKNRDYAQVLEERNAGAGLIASYIYGDDLIYMNRDGANYFYHYDGNGNTRQLSNAGGNITDTYIYDAFGIMLDSTGVTINNYLYTGEQYDVNIGFYYLRARYYMPQLCRFLTPDIFVGSIFEPQSLHKYVYVFNNPVNYNDPSGLFTIFSINTSLCIRSILRGAIIGGVLSAFSWFLKGGRGGGKGLAREILIGALTGSLTGGFSKYFQAMGVLGWIGFFSTLSTVKYIAITENPDLLGGGIAFMCGAFFAYYGYEYPSFIGDQEIMHSLEEGWRLLISLGQIELSVFLGEMKERVPQFMRSLKEIQKEHEKL